MTSSMMSGERRWGSRRGGMTVLGKVAVPKPINLPSQKLENHGLDPNVEIVPKGTVSWGSRPSSSSSNPWGSSTLSPRADGSTGSPSHISGRPSSGGSGTRPSTGSSDKAHESTASAWNSNSRPSSASGALASNQTSATSLRPRSAETRPGSSQLSRFAEPLSENSGAWSAVGTAEKLGVTSSKKDGFSLASGDFPTLGSEKDSAEPNMESQDLGCHGRPGSSSGGVVPNKDRMGTFITGDVSVNANVKSEAANTWRRDSNTYEDNGRPSVEKWQADPQGPHPYPNTGIPQQHYEAWHGRPMNNHPGGVWYRGPPPGPPGPPFGSPVRPGGFPLEPFPFYRPQVPANALANPQPVPPPGAGPRAHHPKNGDMYRPPMPDAYMRPVMPMRPGFYPGPVAYEGYYGPPVGYRNSNEREVPFMGMASGPHSYNIYSGQNAHDASNSHDRSNACGPNSKALASEQVEPGHCVDARGPNRVLLKQQDGWEGKNKDQKRAHNCIGAANVSHFEKGDPQKLLSWDDDCGEYYKKDEQMGSKRKVFGEEASYQVSGHEGGSSSVSKLSENVGNARVVNDFSGKKVEHSAASSPEIPAGPNDSSLIKKIESLNAKARASDGRHDLMSVSSKEQKITSHVDNADSDETSTGIIYVGKHHSTGTNNYAAYDGSTAVGDKSYESTVANIPIISRRPSHGMLGRTDHRGKGRFSSQEADGWREKYPVTESSVDMCVAHSENTNILNQDHPANEVPKTSEFYTEGSDGGESVPFMSEPSDSGAQRAKMRDLAQQRVKQRQKEEEERERDQKAKALAKLEELNRRTQAAEGLTQTLEITPSVSVLNKSEEFQPMNQSTLVSYEVASKSGASGPSSVSDSTIAAQISEMGTTGLEKSTGLSTEQLLERPKGGHKESVGVHKYNKSVPVTQKAKEADVVYQSNTPQVYDISVSKHKSLSYKPKQNIPHERNCCEKVIATSASEPLDGHTDLTVNAAASLEVVSNQIASTCESSQRVNLNIVTESSIQQRRRNNRGGKKNKVEEAASDATLPSRVSTETIPLNEPSVISVKTKASQSELDPISVQSLTDLNDARPSSEMHLSSPREENHVRANNQWKSQHPRKMARSGQSNKLSDKSHTNEAVIWAPVRTQNKAEVPDESSYKPTVEASSVRSDSQVQNNSRNKRAEIERYIPKPVAKEMAQQSIVQQPLVADKAMSDDVDEKVDSGFQGVEGSQPAGFASGSLMESKNGNHRQNKQGKVHGSWRQRASSESTVVLGLQDAEPSIAIRNVQKSVEYQRIQKPAISSLKEQPKDSDEFSDGWNMPEYPEPTVAVNVTVVKDQGVTVRGKQHQFKGNRGSGNNRDHNHTKNNSGDSHKRFSQSSLPVYETSQTDLPCALKENPVSGDRSTPHWQPKPHGCVTSNQHGSRPKSGPNVGAEVGRNKKDSTPQVAIPPLPAKETSQGVARTHHVHSTSGLSRGETVSDVGHEEPMRERKIASVKGRPDSPNHCPANLVENALPSNINIRNEQHMLSGYRRNGNQNHRLNRSYESHGDWSLTGQDNKQHNQPMNRERQRHNAHYEYQPVGPQSNNRTNNSEGPKDPPNNGGGKYRERSQSHSRRGAGTHHGRPSGTIRADGYD